MIGKRLSVSIVVAAAIATGGSTAVASTAGSAEWHDALHVRSTALNERYGLTDTAPRRQATSPSGWKEALAARSEALNRRYGLDDRARTRSSATPSWLEALIARSDALNRTHGLGDYRP